MNRGIGHFVRRFTSVAGNETIQSIPLFGIGDYDAYKREFNARMLALMSHSDTHDLDDTEPDTHIEYHDDDNSDGNQRDRLTFENSSDGNAMNLAVANQAQTPSATIDTNDDSEPYDTLVFPLVQMGPYNIRQDERCTVGTFVRQPT